MQKHFLDKATKAMLNATGSMVCCWTMDEEIFFCSDSFLVFFEIKSTERYINSSQSLSPIRQLCGEKSCLLMSEHLQKAKNQGSHSFQWTHTINNILIPMEYEITLVRQGEFDFLLASIKEHQGSNKCQSENEADIRARATLDAAPLSITFWSRDFKAIDCNAETLRMLGFNYKNEYLESIYHAFPEYQPDGTKSIIKAKEIIASTFKNGFYHGEWIYKNSQGQNVPTEVNLVRIKFADQHIVVEYARDLSEIIASNEKVKLAEQRTLAMLDSLPIGVNLWSTELKPLDCNKAAMQMLGIESKDEYMHKFFECVPEFQASGEKSLDMISRTINEVFISGYMRFEWNFKTLFGEILPAEITLIRTQHRNEPIVIGFTRDLRELKESENRARAAEERTQIMLDTTPLCANFWNQNFQNIDCNLAAMKLFDLNDKQEYLEKFFELSPEFQPDGKLSSESALEKITVAFEEGYCQFEWMHQKLNGEPIPSEITLIRTQFHNEYIVIGYTKDLRELKASQELTREAEARTQAMFDSTPLCIKLWDDSQNLIDCNEESLRLFGFTSKQDMLDNFDQTLPEFQPDNQNSLVFVLEKLTTALNNGYCRFEANYKHPISHESIPAELTLVRIKDRDRYAIVSYLRDLRELNAMLQEIRTVEDDLRKAHDVAEKNAQAKSEFLANMSHEIRTPMNGILGLLYLLSQTELANTQESYVKKIIFSANNLLRIINDILDFSKIEAGKLEVESIPFTLSEICDELNDLFFQKAEEKGVELYVNCSEFSKTYLLSDPLRIKQIIFNLTSNALKFTEKGYIDISIHSKKINDDTINCLFAIQDTGIGLSQEQMDRIFTAFTQADSSVTRKYGGTGLGLVISRSLAQMLGGKIEISSKVNEGSTFSFECSFAIAPEEDVKKLKKVEEDATYQPKNQHGHLLLVEDNEINQIIAVELLESAGYTVDIAPNGQEGINLLYRNSYDLVLMDIQMPIMDGLTATKTIREDKAFADLPIIAMSAHAMTGDKEVSLEHGMNDHITKPINPQKLYSALTYWLNKKN